MLPMDLELHFWIQRMAVYWCCLFRSCSVVFDLDRAFLMEPQLYSNCLRLTGQSKEK